MANPSKNDPRASFGEWLKLRRIAAEMTPLDLAHKLDIDVAVYRDIEAGKRGVTDALLVKMARLERLRVTLRDLRAKAWIVEADEAEAAAALAASQPQKKARPLLATVLEHECQRAGISMAQLLKVCRLAPTLMEDIENGYVPGDRELEAFAEALDLPSAMLKQIHDDALTGASERVELAPRGLDPIMQAAPEKKARAMLAVVLEHECQRAGISIPQLLKICRLPPDLYAKIEDGFKPGAMALERFADALELPLSALEHVDQIVEEEPPAPSGPLAPATPAVPVETAARPRAMLAIVLEHECQRAGISIAQLLKICRLPPDLFAKIEDGFMPGQMALERFADALELPLSALEHVSAEGEVTEKTSSGGL